VRPLALFMAFAIACSPNFDVPGEDRENGLAVSVEPVGTLEAAPAVFRMRVAGDVGRSALADYRLFSGTLGAYHVGRIKSRILPATLLEREIPLLNWADERDIVVAPLAALASGPYALATPELGLVAEVVVDAALVAVVERAWPPREATLGAGVAVFCGEAAGAVAEGLVELAPAGVQASVARGLDDEGTARNSCVRVEPSGVPETGIPLLPPAFSGGVAFEPRVLVVARARAEARPCFESELTLGPICGAVFDDRVELHSTGDPAFVALEEPRALVGVVSLDRSLVLRGFEASSVTRVSGIAFDVLGERTRLDHEIETLPARPHVVLNEVLANPVGPEAPSEWIEIVNDGARPVNLGGFLLDDAIEPVPLPAHDLAPGAFALIVAEGYAPDPELDLVPAPDATLVVVPRLGRSGLANSGELLRLRDPDGTVVSRFPARAAPGPGTSVARRAPDAPDAESGSFASHAAPGASPGRENTVETPPALR
jgi:hypothetical protein